jgi:VanZ family protein
MANKYSKTLLVIMLIGTMLFAFAPGQWTPAWVVNHDKWVHLLVFFCLSVVLSMVLPYLKLLTHLMSLLSFACFIEYVQYNFVGRGFSIEDILFDVLGVMFLYLIVYGVKLLTLNKNRRSC